MGARDLYGGNEYCMKFSNREILEHIVMPASSCYYGVGIRSRQYEDIPFDTEEEIATVFFGNENDEFYIRFYGEFTEFYVLNEEFMFFDEKIKDNVCSSDTYGNIVYEGHLRQKTHEEILRMFFELFKICRGAKSIAVEETVVSRVGTGYPRCSYVVRIANGSGVQETVELENILFLINQ